MSRRANSFTRLPCTVKQTYCKHRAMGEAFRVELLRDRPQPASGMLFETIAAGHGANEKRTARRRDQQRRFAADLPAEQRLHRAQPRVDVVRRRRECRQTHALERVERRLFRDRALGDAGRIAHQYHFRADVFVRSTGAAATSPRPAFPARCSPPGLPRELTIAPDGRPDRSRPRDFCRSRSLRSGDIPAPPRSPAPHGNPD